MSINMDGWTKVQSWEELLALPRGTVISVMDLPHDLMVGELANVARIDPDSGLGALYGEYAILKVSRGAHCYGSDYIKVADLEQGLEIMRRGKGKGAWQYEWNPNGYAVYKSAFGSDQTEIWYYGVKPDTTVKNAALGDVSLFTRELRTKEEIEAVSPGTLVCLVSNALTLGDPLIQVFKLKGVKDAAVGGRILVQDDLIAERYVQAVDNERVQAVVDQYETAPTHLPQYRLLLPGGRVRDSQHLFILRDSTQQDYVKEAEIDQKELTELRGNIEQVMLQVYDLVETPINANTPDGFFGLKGMLSLLHTPTGANDSGTAAYNRYVHIRSDLPAGEFNFQPVGGIHFNEVRDMWVDLMEDVRNCYVDLRTIRDVFFRPGTNLQAHHIKVLKSKLKSIVNKLTRKVESHFRELETYLIRLPVMRGGSRWYFYGYDKRKFDNRISRIRYSLALLLDKVELFYDIQSRQDKMQKTIQDTLHKMYEEQELTVKSASDELSDNDYDLLAEVYNDIWGDAYVEKNLDTLEELAFSALPDGGRVLDLCCGAGRLADLLAGRGYAVTGIDSSRGMVSKAKESVPKAEFIVGDARDFTLNEPVSLVTCTFSALNDIADPRDLEKVFRCVYDALEPGGRFIFDVGTDEEYRRYGNTQADYSTKDYQLHLTRSYDPDTQLCHWTTDVSRDGETVKRIEYSQRCHSAEELQELLSDTGFEDIDAVYAEENEDGHMRVFFTAKKPVTKQSASTFISAEELNRMWAGKGVGAKVKFQIYKDGVNPEEVEGRVVAISATPDADNPTETFLVIHGPYTVTQASRRYRRLPTSSDLVVVEPAPIEFPFGIGERVKVKTQSEPTPLWVYMGQEGVVTAYASYQQLNNSTLLSTHVKLDSGKVIGVDGAAHQLERVGVNQTQIKNAHVPPQLRNCGIGAKVSFMGHSEWGDPEQVTGVVRSVYNSERTGWVVTAIAQTAQGYRYDAQLDFDDPTLEILEPVPLEQPAFYVGQEVTTAGGHRRGRVSQVVIYRTGHMQRTTIRYYVTDEKGQEFGIPERGLLPVAAQPEIKNASYLQDILPYIRNAGVGAVVHIPDSGDKRYRVTQVAIGEDACRIYAMHTEGTGGSITVRVPEALIVDEPVPLVLPDGRPGQPAYYIRKEPARAVTIHSVVVDERGAHYVINHVVNGACAIVPADEVILLGPPATIIKGSESSPAARAATQSVRHEGGGGQEGAGGRVPVVIDDTTPPVPLKRSQVSKDVWEEPWRLVRDMGVGAVVRPKNPEGIYRYIGQAKVNQVRLTQGGWVLLEVIDAENTVHVIQEPAAWEAVSPVTLSYPNYMDQDVVFPDGEVLRINTYAWDSAGTHVADVFGEDALESEVAPAQNQTEIKNAKKDRINLKKLAKKLIFSLKRGT